MNCVAVFILIPISADITKTWACKTLEDCNLNGDCVNEICHCDPWWSGDRCSALNFKPASTKFAYKQHYGANGLVNSSFELTDVIVYLPFRM